MNAIQTSGVVLILAGGVFAAGCGDSTDSMAIDGSGGGSGQASGSAGMSGAAGKEGMSGEGGAAGSDMGVDTNRMVDLTLDGVEPLGAGFIYEGWLVFDDGPKSTGRFQVEAGKTMYSFKVPDVNGSKAFVLTIEMKEGDDPAPSKVKLLGGDLTNGQAMLTLKHAAALGTGFEDAAGSFILAVPTGVDGTDYTQGIWFLDPSAGPGASLKLPVLPEGWVYEGWVASDQGPVSTGRFSKADMADSDGAGATKGPNAAPPFPGQDFVNPPTSLTAMPHKAVISVEPEPDDSPMPFAIKPLVGDIAAAGKGVSQTLANNSTKVPHGQVMIK